MHQIGFIGNSDTYDLILYLSRILFHLGKKVLLVEASPSGELSAAVPIPPGIKPDDVVEYRGVSFLKSFPDTPISSLSNYDIVIYHFGTSWHGVELCTQRIYVTDQKKSSVMFLASHPAAASDDTEWLLIRDVISCGIRPDYIKQSAAFQTEHTYLLYQDDLDTRRKIRCQYDDTIVFRGLSQPMQSFLKDLIQIIEPELPKKEYWKAYHKAEGGK